MYGKAFAPEYRGASTSLSVNSSLVDVPAVAEAHRRPGRRRR
ncbi:hypothetical protein ACGFZS_19735 [Streptomyces sp. NPDC048288]